VWVCNDVDVAGADDAPEADSDGGGLPPSDPDEHPTRTAEQAAAAAITARRGWLRMRSIYATLANVMERTTQQECCRA
jgi:hypothetical protein